PFFLPRSVGSPCSLTLFFSMPKFFRWDSLLDTVTFRPRFLLLPKAQFPPGSLHMAGQCARISLAELAESGELFRMLSRVGGRMVFASADGASHPRRVAGHVTELDVAPAAYRCVYVEALALCLMLRTC